MKIVGVATVSPPEGGRAVVFFHQAKDHPSLNKAVTVATKSRILIAAGFIRPD
jgi:hypothetical protein